MKTTTLPVYLIRFIFCGGIPKPRYRAWNNVRACSYLDGGSKNTCNISKTNKCVSTVPVERFASPAKVKIENECLDKFSLLHD